jgi:hypothetical protein
MSAPNAGAVHGSSMNRPEPHAIAPQQMIERAVHRAEKRAAIALALLVGDLRGNAYSRSFIQRLYRAMTWQYSGVIIAGRSPRAGRQAGTASSATASSSTSMDAASWARRATTPYA